MDHYSIEQKQAIIAFLHRVISLDKEIKIDEFNIVWVFAKYASVDMNIVDHMTDDQLLISMTTLNDHQWMEVMRMGYTLMRMDDNRQENEKKMIDFMIHLRKSNLSDYHHFYRCMNKLIDLTPLDQMVLLLLSHHIAESDGMITEVEAELLVVLRSMMNMNPDEFIHYRLPKDALYSMVFQMNKSAVRRIVEELMIIVIADFKISENEYNFILPIITHFQFDLEDILSVSKNRFSEHIEYYELFRIQTEVN